MINISTGEEKEMILSLSEREELLAAGEYKQKLTTAKFISSTDGWARKQAGSGWNDVLNKVKKGSARNNTIKT
jgi:hypothetical protein